MPTRARDGDSSVALQFHCNGFKALASHPKLPTLRKAFNLPSASPLQGLIVSRFASALADSLDLKSNAAAGKLLEPLVTDFLGNESYGALGGAPARPWHYLFAVRTGPARAAAWHDALDKVFGGPGEGYAVEDNKGLRWHPGDDGGFWMLAAGEWTVVGWGDDLSSILSDCLRRIRENKPSTPGTWLEATLDGATMAGHLPAGAWPLRPGVTKATLSIEDDKLLLQAHVKYTTATGWTPAAWHLPVELVQGPLSSFSVGQNINVLLSPISEILGLEGNPLTNQFCAWGREQMPLQTYAAWPVSHASNVLQALSTQAPKALNPGLAKSTGTELRWQADRQRLLLTDLRVMGPTVEAVQAPAGGFLVLSMFPRSPFSSPAPEKLWAAVLGRTNLIYYDWELTGLRLQQWQFLGSILLSKSVLLHPELQSDTVFSGRLVEQKWLRELRPLLGQTLTEITAAGPNEVSLVREGPFCLTGVEMFFLSDWLGALGVEPVAPAARVPGPGGRRVPSS
jgi:hypothetical protein